MVEATNNVGHVNSQSTRQPQRLCC